MSYSRDNVAQLRELGIPTKTAKYALEVNVYLLGSRDMFSWSRYILGERREG